MLGRFAWRSGMLRLPAFQLLFSSGTKFLLAGAEPFAFGLGAATSLRVLLLAWNRFISGPASIFAIL